MNFLELACRRVAVNVHNEEEATEFVRCAVEGGFAKNDWSEFDTHYQTYKCETCYEIRASGNMFFAGIGFYLKRGYRVVTMEDIDNFSNKEIQLSSSNISELLL